MSGHAGAYLSQTRVGVRALRIMFVVACVFASDFAYRYLIAQHAIHAFQFERDVREEQITAPLVRNRKNEFVLAFIEQGLVNRRQVRRGYLFVAATDIRDVRFGAPARSVFLDKTEEPCFRSDALVLCVACGVSDLTDLVALGKEDLSPEVMSCANDMLRNLARYEREE